MTDQLAKYIEPADAGEYVSSAVQTFLGDPPDTDFQRGFLTALLVSRKRRWGIEWTCRLMPKPDLRTL